MTALYIVLSDTGLVRSAFDDKSRAYQEVCDEILFYHYYPEDYQNEFTALYEQRKFEEAYNKACLMNIAAGFQLAIVELNKSGFINE